MRCRRIVVALALCVLVGCGDDTPTNAGPETGTNASADGVATTSAVATTEAVDPVYGSLEAGMHPIDAGPGSVITTLLNELPQREPIVAEGLRPIGTQLKLLPLIEGCPEPLPVARTERLAARFSDDGQIVDVLLQVASTMWASPQEAEAALEFFGTPAAHRCEREEVEQGFEFNDQPGSPSIVSYEPSEAIDSLHPEIEGVRSFRKVVVSEQFDTEFTQTIHGSVVARGSVLWTWSVAVLPGIDVPEPLTVLGGEWLASRPALELPPPDHAADRAAEQLLTALDADVDVPEWFEPVGQVELSPTRLDESCSSFVSTPIAAASGADHVAISQVAASSIDEEAATFSTAAEAATEVDNFEAEMLGCIESATEELLTVGFSRAGEQMERVVVDGIEVAVATIDLVQTVGERDFDVRLIAALGAVGTHAVHFSFEGLAGDEPDVARLVAARLELLSVGE